MTEPSHAVFLSYASEDAQAAKKICEALCAAGIEVWFDQSELRGGDAWDRKIREQIHDCRLFIPVISANSEHRDEGYFRREWSLAVDRTRDMALKRAFLVPVVIDNTPARGTSVPEKFHELQWTRLPDGETSPAFVERIQRLLLPEGSTPIREPASTQSGAVGVIRASAQPAWSRRRGLFVAVSLVILAAVAYFAGEKFWVAKPSVSSPAVVASRAPAPSAFTPPAHSIAVLPFANLTGDKDQDYFSEGLTEEILNSLTDIAGLQVSGRTSAFSFQGTDTDLGTIARKLDVGAILEGSVRRSGHTVRITAQLMNAVTGFEVWSKSYDRDLGDVLKLQTEIATAVADALKVTLLGDISAKIELGGTRNAAALDAYLRASSSFQSMREAKELPTGAIAEYTEAIRLDPNYALAFAYRSAALATYAQQAATGAEIRKSVENAEADAHRAIALAPELAEAHVALAYVSVASLDFSQANREYERALTLAPGNALVLSGSSVLLAYMGHFDEAIAAARRSLVLEPLDPDSYDVLGVALDAARRYTEAAKAYAEEISLYPDYKLTYGRRGLAFYEAGDLGSARASCEIRPDNYSSQVCLAVVYDKLGRHADAQAELAKMDASLGDSAAYQYAQIYAQWGNRAKALEWLDIAMRLRDSGLVGVKTDSLMDPLRQEPRFQAIERELKFPD